MKVTNKSARRNGRKQAEADDLPWARDMDFKEARANATWDDSIYDPKTLAAMEAVRTHNAAVITQLDGKIAEQQRKETSIPDRIAQQELIESQVSHVSPKKTIRKTPIHRNSRLRDAKVAGRRAKPRTKLNLAPPILITQANSLSPLPRTKPELQNSIRPHQTKSSRPPKPALFLQTVLPKFSSAGTRGKRS